MDRFANLDGSTVDKGFGDLLKWKLAKRERPAKGAATPTKPTPRVENDGTRVRVAEAAALTWIGHASFLVQIGGQSLLVDPIYVSRLFTLKRAVAPGLAIANLPPIDAVLITHNHRDHLDTDSLAALATSGRGGKAPLFVVPKGVGPTVTAAAKGARATELGWWEHADLGGARVTLVPSQHWSQRGVLDRNRTLWGGYVVEGDGTRVYHSGDTAYFDGFRLIKERVGKIDAAMLPIGAYEPRWFMRGQHMNPDDAVQAFLDLGAERFVAMHWGTFHLTDEPLDEPPTALAEVLTHRGLVDPAVFLVPAVGETLFLGRPSQRT